MVGIVGWVEEQNPDPKRLKSTLNLRKLYPDQCCAK
jgi:hypothetical protein